MIDVRAGPPPGQRRLPGRPEVRYAHGVSSRRPCGYQEPLGEYGNNAAAKRGDE